MKKVNFCPWLSVGGAVLSLALSVNTANAAQAYAAVTDGESVLIAQKKVMNAFWQGREQREQVVHQAGQWALPGGGIKGRQTPIEAAREEFWEETGISIAQLQGADIRRPGYYLVIFQVNEDDLGRFLMTGNNNIRSRRVRDGELALLHVEPIDTVHCFLGVQQPIPYNYEDEVRREAHRDRYSQSIDWYGEMATALQRHFNTRPGHCR